MRTFKIDKLKDWEIESLLHEYKVKYEEEIDNILETRSPNDYVLDEIYQIICVLSEVIDTRNALMRIIYESESIGVIPKGHDYYRGFSDAADIARRALRDE